MAYTILNIGRVFSEKTREQLTQRLNDYEQQGWEFHSVFGVSEQAGCLGQNTSETLYVVFKSKPN